MALHNELGHWGEQLAANYLESKGWYIRHKDWRYNHKDIDIVCIDEDMTTLLIVEVKTRSTDIWGAPDEAIDLEKRKNIIQAAAAYIHMYNLEHLNLRYDSISIIGTPQTSYKLEHKENVIDVVDQFLYYEQKHKNSHFANIHRKGCWK